jgi:hypothetical protein
MKKKIILFAVLIVCLSNFHSIAQTFGNEWINYNQTYFKLKVAKWRYERGSRVLMEKINEFSLTISGNQQMLGLLKTTIGQKLSKNLLSIIS